MEIYEGRTRRPPVAVEFCGLVVIVPTRNRAELAIRAIRSVLADQVDEVWVLVSDNSTDSIEVSRLHDYCKGLDTPKVRYVRPPEPLAMSYHWEWIFKYALDNYPSNHITVLGDRRIFREGCLREVVDILRRHPGPILVYDQTTVIDHKLPVRIWQRPWSGQLLEIDGEDMLRANAHAAWLGLVPVLQNCVVTRQALAQVRERFGNWFLSFSPDYVFGFRALDVVDRILVYDKPIIIGSALGRSNGFSLSRGVRTSDNKDFFSTNPGLERGFYAAPIPEILIANNAVFHEYGVVRGEAGSDRLPEIDVNNYLDTLFAEVIGLVEDPDLRRFYLNVLAGRGHLGAMQSSGASALAGPSAAGPTATRMGSLKRAVRSVLDHPPLRPIRLVLNLGLHPKRAVRTVLSGRSFRDLWRILRYRFHRPIPPWAADQIDTYNSTDEAVFYLNKYQIGRSLEPDSLRSSSPKGLFEKFPFKIISNK